MRVRARGSAIVLGAVIIGSLVQAGSAAAATGTLRGTAICNSARPVVGIWIESSAGGSGWASFFKAPGKQNTAYYSLALTFSGTSTSAYPIVGCGGTPSDWASSNAAPALTFSGTFVYNVRCADPPSGTGVCSGAPWKGGHATNTFACGECTWGAAEMWRKAAPADIAWKYPKWSGDAKDWDNNAAALGFRIVTVPHERSIAVFEPGVGCDCPLGHVAWITKPPWISGGKLKFHVLEMNWVGWNQWSERDVTYVAGMHFIVATPGRIVTVQPGACPGSGA